MISVGSRDGRKGVELRFGREDMEETELEEGEACFNDPNDEENDSSTIDPDVALSYLDEKLQDVLGHFQKDFEGGVSAENLGAKFGGYGSFLPTYQHSPSWSRPRSPAQCNHYGSRSPNNGHLQNGQANSFYSSPEMISSNSATGFRPISHDNQGTPGINVLPDHGKELPSKSGLPKSTNLSNQKTLKVRIKVGKDNLSSQKNAQIYSGLGLDDSPSSSLNESPTDSEGLHRNLLDISDESLTRIIQIMTSATLFGSLLLSPLSDEVINLAKEEWSSCQSGRMSVESENQGDVRKVANGCDLKMSNRKMSHGNKSKVIGQSAVLVSPTTRNKNFISHATSVVPKNETEINTIDCEELISSTLKLPLLSDADVADLGKGGVKSKVDSKASLNGAVKSDLCSDMAENEPSDPLASLDNSRATKSTKRSSGKAVESGKAKNFNRNLAYQKKEVSRTDETGDWAVKYETHGCEDEISVRADFDTSHQRFVERSSFDDEDISKLNSSALQLPSGNKRANGNQSLVAEDMKSLKDGKLNNSFTLHLSKKSSKPSELKSKRGLEGLMKGLGKTVDRHKDCLGDFELEKDDDNLGSEEMPSLEKDKGSELVENRSIDKSSNILKEKAAERKSEELSALDRQYLTSNVSRLARKVPNPNAAPTAAAPLVNEDWVCCDKCQTWRLLPLGKNPKSLPKKWVCSMLDWLPGLNHCTISEDETTLALRTAQASAASQSKHTQHPPSTTNLSGVSSGDVQKATDDNHCAGFQEATAVKKNNVATDIANTLYQENFSLVPNSKKRHQESPKVRSLNDIEDSPSINDFGYQYVGQSSVSLEGRCLERNKNIPVNYHSDKTDTSKSKIKNRKDRDADGKRASKKMKLRDSHLKEENHASEVCQDSSIVDPSSNSGLSSSALRKDCYDNNFRNSEGGMEKFSRSSERPEVPNSVSSDDGSHLLLVHSLDDDVKKRKVNDSVVNEMPLPGLGNHSLGSRSLLKECNDTGERREKKARISKSEGKDCKGNRDNSGTVKKVSRGTKDILGQDAADPSGRDSGSLLPAVAATSSSSKVTSSHKSKASLQEMKDSPVESVSSSPLRTSNVSQLSHSRREAASKDNFQDAGVFVNASPRLSVNDEHIFDTDQTGKMRCDDNMDLLQSVKSKAEASSPHFATQHLTNGNITSPDQGKQHSCQVETLEQIPNEGDRKVNQYASHSKKAGKGFSSRLKEKAQVSRSLNDNGDPSCEDKSKAGSNKSQEKTDIPFDKTDKSHVSKKDSAENLDQRNCKETPPQLGVHDGANARGDVISCQDMKHKVLQDSENGRSSRCLNTIVNEGPERGKSNSIQHSLRDQRDTIPNVQPVVVLKKENGDCINENGEQSKALKQSKKPEKTSVNQQVSVRKSSSSAHKGRAGGAPSPAPKDPSSQSVTNAIKEAKDLKHLADRLKNSGAAESTGLYFQAALKFLHGASLIESGSSENTKTAESQSMQIYSSTAKLCEFCAHEYEKSKDMAAAALAYKCVEVAYMRVIYTSHTGASKHRNMVQAALQFIPTGDSPSSSASDIDNLNNTAVVDKAIASKGVKSPQVVASHVLTAHNRASCLRLVQFAQEVTFAMEASRKSRTRLGEAQNREGISSVKRALDFNFQDVDGLLRLMIAKMEIRQVFDYPFQENGFEHESFMTCIGRVCLVTLLNLCPNSLQVKRCCCTRSRSICKCCRAMDTAWLTDAKTERQLFVCSAWDDQ